MGLSPDRGRVDVGDPILQLVQGTEGGGGVAGVDRTGEPILHSANSRPAFVVDDGNYVSARWPGDTHTFATVLSDKLKKLKTQS